MLSRDHEEVDDGWLCDKGRFAYQAIHVDERITRPLVRDGGELREVSWERALSAAAALARHKGHVGALVGGQATNEEGFLLARLMREVLDSSDIDSRASGAPTAGQARALAAPGLQATVPDLEFAHTVLLVGCEPLDDAPILDLRIRKGVRRNGVKLAILGARPSALDRNADQIFRCAPGEEHLALKRSRPRWTATARGRRGQRAGDVAARRWRGRRDRLGRADRRRCAALLLAIAERLELGGRDGAGLLEIPAGSNGRGLREAGAVPDAGPGHASLRRRSAGT